MPPKNPGTSYTGKPVRRLKLPKIGPTKTQNFFEEYLYALLAVVFFAVTILGKAGGFSTYNAVVIGAWVTAILWCGHQLKDYFVEKSKAVNGKTHAPQPGGRPSWPKLPKQRQVATAQAATSQTPADQTSTVQTPGQMPETGSGEKKRAFVYERPTLPDRKPKLPHNWANLNDKKQNDKKRDHKKPKR